MLQSIDYFLLFLYDIAIIFILLNIDFKRLSRKRQMLFIASITLISGLVIYTLTCLGSIIYMTYFPIIVQIPLFLAYSLVSEYHGFKMLFIFMVSSIWILPILILSNALAIFSASRIIIMLLCHVLLFFPFLYMIKRYFKQLHKFILDSNQKGWPLFCLIPFICIMSMYMSSRVSINYTPELVNKTNIWRFALNALAFISYLLIIINFKQLKEKFDIESKVQFIDTQLYGANKYIDSLKNSHNQAAIYYHDLRHHLQLINAHAQAENNQDIIDYISSIQQNIDMSEVRPFCKNTTINLILSAFYTKAREEKISLLISGNIPENLKIPETDFCVLLSNALENAINAVKAVAIRPREIKLSFHSRNNQFFLEIVNPYEGHLKLENGVPKTSNKNEGHGIGTKSILLIVEKHGGILDFETVDGNFVLRVII